VTLIIFFFVWKSWEVVYVNKDRVLAILFFRFS
jgi:hypothetical protein